MIISTNTGKVYRPKDSERLILYLKDVNLPKPDKWGTSQLIAFLQQVPVHIYNCCTCHWLICYPVTVQSIPVCTQALTYRGFYDNNLEWVGLEGVQIVASMNGGSTLGRHALSTRFTSIVRICCVGYVYSVPTGVLL